LSLDTPQPSTTIPPSAAEKSETIAVPPAGKPKTKPVSLPEKLVGKVDEVHRTKAPLIRIPGDVGNFYQRSEFKNCRPRTGGTPATQSVEVRILVTNEPERRVRVRKEEGTIWEILGGAFEMEEFPEGDKLKLLSKPFTTEDGAGFKFERHADEGGEVLEGMYVNRCASIEESRILANSRRAGGQI
jgi:hypothetical protein